MGEKEKLYKNQWVTDSLVLFPMRAENDEDAIRQLGELLVKHSVVKESWINAALEREKVFATGLPTPEIGVAIPHADAEYVLKQAIAIGVLDHPVSFGEMGSEGNRVDVQIVCALAVEKSEMLVPLLNKLVEVFQSPGVLSNITNAKSPQEVADLFNLYLNQSKEE